MTLPPLLMIAEGRKPRLRKAPVSLPKEVLLHMAVARVLRVQGAPQWRWTHIPSGELIRDKETARKLKQMGTQTGWPDFILVSPYGSVRCLELKRRGESLSEDQEAFSLHCIKHGIPYSVAYDRDQALAALSAWGAIWTTERRG